MIDFSALLTTSGLISVLTLSVLEIVLGIDNIIFISIIAGKLPTKKDQRKARRIGLSLALIIRIALLFSISWIVGLTEPLLTILGHPITGRSAILLAGGVFLVIKTGKEIQEKINHTPEKEMSIGKLTLNSAIAQIVLIDIIFSFDSILTAVGLVNNVIIMVHAVIIAMLVMLAFSEKVSDFINNHAPVKMLALVFLVVIGLLLILEAFSIHIDKTYIYVALAFSMIVETLNIKVRSNAHKNKDS